MMTKQNEPPPNCVGCDADVCTCFRDDACDYRDKPGAEVPITHQHEIEHLSGEVEHLSGEVERLREIEKAARAARAGLRVALDGDVHRPTVEQALATLDGYLPATT